MPRETIKGPGTASLLHQGRSICPGPAEWFLCWLGPLNSKEINFLKKGQNYTYNGHFGKKNYEIDKELVGTNANCPHMFRRAWCPVTHILLMIIQQKNLNGLDLQRRFFYHFSTRNSP